MKRIERAAPAKPYVPAMVSSSLERETILYVEDEDENWVVAELRLKRLYELVRAREAREACEALHRYGERLTAILMDIQLHGSLLSGIDLTRLIRGRLPRSSMPAFALGVPTLEVPVIFVTAYGGRYTEADLVAAGGDRLLPKPVDFVQLGASITQLKLQRMQRVERLGA